jgi:hypothetical protein
VIVSPGVVRWRGMMAEIGCCVTKPLTLLHLLHPVCDETRARFAGKEASRRAVAGISWRANAVYSLVGDSADMVH